SDDNILPYLKHIIYGDNLSLESESNVSFSTKTPIEYHATVKDLASIKSSGSIEVTSDDITSNQFTIHSSGASDINIKKIKTQSLTIDSSGSSKINLPNIDTKKLTIDVSGSSNFKLAGEADEQIIDISGASKYNAQELKSNNTRINASGAIKMYLNVMNNIKGKASGASSVIYNGNHR